MRKIPFYKNLRQDKAYIKEPYKILLIDVESQEKLPITSATKAAKFLGLSTAACLERYTTTEAIISNRAFTHPSNGKTYKIRRVKS